MVGMCGRDETKEKAGKEVSVEPVKRGNRAKRAKKAAWRSSRRI